MRGAEGLGSVQSGITPGLSIFFTHLDHYADEVQRSQRVGINIERLYEFALRFPKFAQVDGPPCTEEAVVKIARRAPERVGFMLFVDDEDVEVHVICELRWWS